MRVHVADHPLITHKLTVLRDQGTPSATFRALTEELVTLLAYEATRHVRTHEVTIQTPVAETVGALSEMKRRGLARNIGISNYTVALLEEAVKLDPQFAQAWAELARKGCVAMEHASR